MKSSRRMALKLFSTSASLLARSMPAACASEAALAASIDEWRQSPDRVWLGKNVWANPMEDWRVVDGAAECQSDKGNRNIALLTHSITDSGGSFEMSVNLQSIDKIGRVGIGFRIGNRSEIDEYRSNVFVSNGIDVGIVEDGLMIRTRKSEKVAPLSRPDWSSSITLRVSGSGDGEKYALFVQAFDDEGEVLGELRQTVPARSVLGNVALVNNFDKNVSASGGMRYRFRDWMVGGDAFEAVPARSFGPILWSMYSLSDSRSDEGFVVKMNALLAPVGANANQDVDLYVFQDERWQKLATSRLDQDAWTATFWIPNWDQHSSKRYKLTYREVHTDGTESVDQWTGMIQANPTDRPLRLAALTCQHWYAFPYQPVVDNVLKLKPDMLYFSGDQLYESHGGYGFAMTPAETAILCYLRKYYMFGWAFRDALKDAPVVVLPDDHDVFQGNIWGEGGKAMANLDDGDSSKGGYREPARMVNVVHRTCVGHHPDAYDSAPSEQDISVYFGDMVYGNVSFAILGDRQWKSGPDRVNADAPRADHVVDPDADTRLLDQPGLELLGERQETFLDAWSKDWRGHTMKVVLSQTVFAGAATHHSEKPGGTYLKADLDCGGWPQTPRDRAIRLMSQGRPLHINGDQHLTTLLQYGVDEQRDGCWSFCTPAISASYQRWWLPDDVGMSHANRPEHGLANTGEYEDGLGNKIYVYALGNPERAVGGDRYSRAHTKASGFGFVTIDTQSKAYHLDCFRFLVDATDGKPENQFPGWPVTIYQDDNRILPRSRSVEPGQ